MIVPQEQVYTRTRTDPPAILPEVRDLLHRCPELSEEEIASRLGIQPQFVGLVLEALRVDGELLT